MKKAQIASIDLVIAMIALIAGLGLLMQFSETKTYEQKETLAKAELEKIGKTASTMLITNPEIICELKTNFENTISYLENCIDTSKTINSKKIGIPSGYYYKIKIGNNTPIGGEPSNAKNVFSEKRIVITHEGSLSKETLEKCQTLGICIGIQKQEATIIVWKE